MNKILDDFTLIEYAQKTAQKIRMTVPATKLLLKYINQMVPKTTLIENEEMLLWIDKYYIAYSRYGEKKTHYVYLTREHIREESKSYMKARKDRKSQVRMPNTIKSNFIKALYDMRKTKLKYYLDKDFFEIG